LAATGGAPDDFTLIDGVSPLQQSTLHSLGIYHFDQIAAWTPANVAWMDRYLRLRGRIGEEEWVEQAAELAEHGVHAARPQTEGARA
jgi:predicted flap endonuclease-1-like 5' DNA nuclease